MQIFEGDLALKLHAKDVMPSLCIFSISFFYGCLRLRFLDVETNPGPRHPVPAVCRIL